VNDESQAQDKKEQAYFENLKSTIDFYIIPTEDSPEMNLKKQRRQKILDKRLN